jgi:hypothetical protein
MSMFSRLAFFLTLTAIFGATEVKADDVPFLVTRLDVYLYDENKAPNADSFAGSIDCNYFNRESKLNEARSLAYNVARARGFHVDGAGRYYIICCIKAGGSIATKVR